MNGQVDGYADLSSNEELALILTRYASIKGVSVQRHRFDYPEVSQDGASLKDLEAAERAVSVWLLRFPFGKAEMLRADQVEKTKLPLLWIPDGDESVFLVRGILSSGMLVEKHDYSSKQVDFSVLDKGVFISLTTGEDAENSDGQSLESAKDWFIFALRKRRKVFLEAIFATFVLSTLGLMSALYTMQVYDRVVPTKGFSTLWVLTIGVLLAIAFEFIMKVVRAHMVDRASKVIDVELSSVFFGKALSIRADARPRTVGTFASQIRRFESIRNFMTSSTLFVFADAPFALFFIGVIFILAGPVALVPLLVMPLGLFIGLSMRKPIERYASEHMEESNKKNGLLIEAIDGIESIKSASAEWKLADRWLMLTKTISESELKSRLLTSISTSSAQSIQQLSYVGIIAVGAYAISNGDLTMGGLIACSIISGRALTPLTQVPGLVVQWKHAEIALDVLDGIMAMPDDSSAERTVVPDNCHGSISAKDVSFNYEEGAPGIEAINFRLNPGDRVALLGSVGSGKSTLLKTLAGLYRPNSGAVFLDDVDSTHLSIDFVREHIGYLPQEVRLFNGSLRDNLVLGLPQLSDSQILNASKLTGLHTAIQNHPKGLDIQISEGGKGLSGGQRQLVGLTRLLLARPEILILDEPTASMDGNLETHVMKHLFEGLSESTAVIVATHKMAVLTHVNRIVVLEKGKIAIDGPKEKVIEHLNKQRQEVKPA